MLHILVDWAKHKSIPESPLLDLAWSFELLKVLKITQIVDVLIF